MTVLLSTFRADMDSNDVIESNEACHIPAKDGFRSCHDKAMHACGHDNTYDHGPWLGRICGNPQG